MIVGDSRPGPINQNEPVNIISSAGVNTAGWTVEEQLPSDGPSAGQPNNFWLTRPNVCVDFRICFYENDDILKSIRRNDGTPLKKKL